MTQSELIKLSDEELIALANANDSDAMEIMMERYKPLVRSLSRKCYLTGGEPEDLVQEGMIGLFNAVKNYELQKGSAFSSFAYTCIKNKLDSAIKESLRDKHKPLFQYLSLNSEDGQRLFSDVNGGANPEDAVAWMDFVDTLKKVLSTYEIEVIMYYYKGYSYSSIAEKLGKSVKSIDNTLQKIKKKIQKTEK